MGHKLEEGAKFTRKALILDAQLRCDLISVIRQTLTAHYSRRRLNAPLSSQYCARSKSASSDIVNLRLKGSHSYMIAQRNADATTRSTLSVLVIVCSIWTSKPGPGNSQPRKRADCCRYQCLWTQEDTVSYYEFGKVLPYIQCAG